MTNCARLFLFLLLVKNVTAQPLDWSGDLVLFGTAQDEHHPCLSATGSNALHAFCIVGSDSLAMKRSVGIGETWSTASKIHAPVSAPLLAAASDGGFTYLFTGSEISPQKRLFRFPPSASEWSAASQLDIAPERLWSVARMSAMTDALAQPGDPYLNIGWVERDVQNHLITVFAQSRDQGASFYPAIVVDSSSAPFEMEASISIAVTWSGEEEKIHLAVPVDRPGSMPEQLRIFRSADQGMTWADGAAVDPSGYPQLSPSLAGYETLLLTVYQRRVDVTAEHDIFYVYSTDQGETFAPPVAITDSISDEFDPQVVVDPVAGQFYIFYQVAAVQQEPATLMVCSASLATPWQIEPANAVSSNSTALRSGGVSVALNSDGAAAAWSSPFDLGDSDVHFDASWRGNSAPLPRIVPSQVAVGCAYPNPFNSVTTIPLTIHRPQHVNVYLTDVIGRRIGTVFSGYLGAGQHTLTANLDSYPSGTYWLQSSFSSQPVQRLVLLR